MRAVVLAAGDGGRLDPFTASLPKPLVPLNGRAIVDYTLGALAEAGIREATVVTGYRETQLRAALTAPRRRPLALSFVTNPAFHRGASFSLRAARESVGEEPFLLVMADHVLSTPIIRTLLAAHAVAPGRSFVAADGTGHDTAYAEEATRLRIREGRVIAIGKLLPTWDALDAGAFVIAPSAWAVIDAAPEDCELSVIFADLARRGGLFAADVSGAFWYDIDTAEDLANASALVAAGA
jgi:choline kinase